MTPVFQFSKAHIHSLTTGSKRVELFPINRTGDCEFDSQLSHTKDLKSVDIDKPGRRFSSGWMLCERLLCPNEELNALEPPTQDPR